MLNIDYSNNVYRPAEDTYLIIYNAIPGNKILEIGSGTGIIAIHFALKNHDVTATDIDENAIELINKNAMKNEINIKIIKSDLFENINEKYDTIIFNPPYLPVENESLQWSGGKSGFDTIYKFLDNAYKYLNQDGNIYIILSDLTDIGNLIKKYKNYKFKKIKCEKFDFESIFLFELKVIQ